MNVTVERLPHSRVKLHIEVPAERMADFFASAYNELSGNVEIAGFRKGKAPRHMVREQVGIDRIVAKAVDLALPGTYHDAVVKESLIPISEPDIHIETVGEDKPLSYTAEVDVLPNVETGNYRNVKVDMKKFAPKEVTQEELDDVLMRLRKAAAVPKPVLRGAQNGDLLDISYTGRVGGVVQEGMQSQNHPVVLGEKSLIPAFEEQLLGLTAGQEKEFTVDVPGRGGSVQAVTFQVKVISVAELPLPELDDTLAKRFGKDNTEAVIAQIKDNLAEEKKQETRGALETAVAEEVIKKATVELPTFLITREIERRIELLTEQLKLSGRTLPDWLKEQKKDMETFTNDMRPSAEQAVKTGLVLRAIADSEGFIKEGEAASEEVLKKTINFLVDLATA